jgi:two-component system, chemotaxis family, response regulator Rcp1
MMARPVHILLVEDNPNDTLLIIRALGEAYSQDLQAVEDGVEALAYLRRQSPYSLIPRPDVVLLDLKLPKQDGWQVLSEIRSEPTLNAIPVIILTALNAEEDYLRRYAGYATACIPKSLPVEEFTTELRGTLHRLLPPAGAHSPNSSDSPTPTASESV